MATTSLELIQGVRRYVRDWPDYDQLASDMLDVGSSSVPVADSSRYYVNEIIEVGFETMVVRSMPDGTHLGVQRAAYGSSVATHPSGSDILMKPSWPSIQILDAINAAIQASYPYVYKEVMDTSITILDDTYEYGVPLMPGTYGGDTIPMYRIRGIDISDGGNVPFVPINSWQLRRDATSPKIKLNYLEGAGAVLRVRGYGPFPDIAMGGYIDSAFPKNLIQGLTEYAASVLLMSGEAGRLRADAMLMDTREAAQRPGSSLSAANAAEARWQRRLSNSAMAPMQGRMTIQG